MPRLRDMDKGELFGGKSQKGKPESKAQVRIDASVLMDELDKLERDLEQIRSQYELFFMGVERQAPKIAQDNVRSQLRRFKEMPNLNTAVKFKFQMLQARLVSLETYWGRVMRQREEGTYHRDLDKARRREAELAEKARAEEAKREIERRQAEEKRRAEDAATRSRGATVARPASVGSEGRALSPQDLRSGSQAGPVAQPGASARPAAAASSAASARPVASRPEDLQDTALRQLYQTYVTAKRRCGEQVDLRYEEMASSLRKQVPKLLQSTGAKAVEFKVVIKSGHAVLKAVPKT